MVNAWSTLRKPSSDINNLGVPDGMAEPKESCAAACAGARKPIGFGMSRMALLAVSACSGARRATASPPSANGGSERRGK